MKPTILILALISLSLASSALAAPSLELKGSLYKLGSNRKQKLYTWEMKTCPELWTSRYRRLDGTLAVEDKTRFEGKRLTEYSYVRHTIGERSSVKIAGNQIKFDFALAGETKSETVTTNDVFLTGPAVFAFIQAHLKELLAGKEFEFKYGVLDMQDYFTFNLSRDSDTSAKSPRIKIRATSLFVRMAISPIYVTLSQDGRFRGITGRSIVMEKSGTRLIPIDADLVVESEAPAQCGAQAPASR